METELRYISPARDYVQNKTITDYNRFKEIANLSLLNGQLDVAEEYYFKALEVKPNCDVICVNLGSLEIQKNNINKAITFYRKAIYLNPKNANGWVGLAIGHRHYGDVELSLANIENALDKDPYHLTARNLYFTWNSKMGNHSKMISFFSQFEDENSCYYLALIYYEIKQYKKSKCLLQKAISISGEDKEKVELMKQLNKEIIHG